MKKLLLSSAVIFFLCSVSFAQAKKAAVGPKASIVVAQKAQTELEKKKMAEAKVLESLTPQQLANMEAEKMKAQKIEKERKLAEKDAQKAETIYNAKGGQ